MTVGPMEGVVSVIAEINAELAGFAQTRLTLPVSAGDVDIPVESVSTWPATGSFLMFGTVYSYSVRTATTLEGLTWTNGETVFNGVVRDLATETIITDLSRATSAMDLLRRAMLVDTADGADLTTVGRNLGVLRLPFLLDDERFRALVKALAYNPRGTLLALHLVLTALLGAGNYEIFEDVVNYPNKVFIRTAGAASLLEVSGGKVYLRGSELRPSDSASQVTVNGAVISDGIVSSVRLASEDRLSNFRTQYPTADAIAEEYPGGSPVYPWTLYGTGISEGTDIQQLALVTEENGAIEFTTEPPTDYAIYGHIARMGVSSIAEASVLFTIPSAGANHGAPLSGITLDDGVKQGVVGIQSVASGFYVGLAAFPAFLGSYVTIARDQYVDVTLRLVPGVRWELLIDGRLVDSVGYSSMGATAGLGAGPAFGKYASGGSSNLLRVKQAGYKVHDPIDYWSVRDSAGSQVDADEISSSGTPFVTGGADDGKRVRTRTGASIPVNNGAWVVDSVISTSQVRLIGELWPGSAGANRGAPAQVGVDAVDRVVIDDRNPQQFVYPDDVGKSIRVSGSTLGNDGDYVIAALLEPGTLTDLSSYDTPITDFKTNIAEITGSFTPESEVSWRMLPAFATEAGTLEFDMVDAGSEAASVLTLRSPTVLPHPTVVTVDYSEVLGGNLLFDAQILNTVITAAPLILEYYPFYITDLMGFIRQYLDDVTAAGVIPEYEF